MKKKPLIFVALLSGALRIPILSLIWSPKNLYCFFYISLSPKKLDCSIPLIRGPRNLYCFFLSYLEPREALLYRLLSGALIVMGFGDTSTRVGYFVSSPRAREENDRRDSRGGEREGQGRRRNRSESEETEKIKTFPPLTLTRYKDNRPCQTPTDAPVALDTWHLRHTPPSDPAYLELILLNLS